MSVCTEMVLLLLSLLILFNFAAGGIIRFSG